MGGEMNKDKPIILLDKFKITFGNSLTDERVNAQLLISVRPRPRILPRFIWQRLIVWLLFVNISLAKEEN
jgi:hypothetical protein